MKKKYFSFSTTIWNLWFYTMCIFKLCIIYNNPFLGLFLQKMSSFGNILCLYLILLCPRDQLVRLCETGACFDISSKLFLFVSLILNRMIKVYKNAKLKLYCMFRIWKNNLKLKWFYRLIDYDCRVIYKKSIMPKFLS